MKRAWRLDPAWIAHYQRRDEERAKREIASLEMEWAMKNNNARLDQLSKIMAEAS